MNSVIEHTVQQQIAEIRNMNLPVIIFGASVVGEVLFHVSKRHGLQIECFCDNNKNLTYFSECNTDIAYPPLLKEKYDDAVFLISSTYIHDVVSQLNELGYSKWYDCSSFLRNLNVSDYSFKTAPDNYVSFFIDACLLSHDGYMNPEKLYLRGIDIMITEKCSLKCRDCSNLTQYYSKPRHIELEEIFRTIDIFCDAVDQIFEFRILGGEALMNKQCEQVTHKLLEQAKAKTVVLYANGTLIPTETHLELLKNPRSLVIITDYGAHSRKLRQLVETFERTGISHYVQKAGAWSDCGHLLTSSHTETEVRDLFKRCCVKNFTTLTDGKLFRCPFSANAHRLEAIPDNEADYIDLFDAADTNMPIHILKEKIRSFLTDKPFLKTCFYCNGRLYGAPEILPAVQVSAPLPYKKVSQ